MPARYTDVASVRSEAWFERNPNVLDATIESYLIQAHWIVQSYISAVYILTNLQPGVSLFDNSQAASLLKRAEELFAAGYLQMKEYWLQALWTERDWQRKIAEAEKLLQRLLDWKNPLRLVNTSWQEFERIIQRKQWKLQWTWIVEWWNDFSVGKVF